MQLSANTTRVFVSRSIRATISACWLSDIEYFQFAIDQGAGEMWQPGQEVGLDEGRGCFIIAHNTPATNSWMLARHTWNSDGILLMKNRFPVIV